jgi:hypothetical protein
MERNKWIDLLERFVSYALVFTDLGQVESGKIHVNVDE